MEPEVSAPVIEPTSRPVEKSGPSEPVPFEETTLSLADNPLLVVEDEQELNANDGQPETTTATGDISGDTTSGESPLSRRGRWPIVEEYA